MSSISGAAAPSPFTEPIITNATHNTFTSSNDVYSTKHMSVGTIAGIIISAFALILCLKYGVRYVITKLFDSDFKWSDLLPNMGWISWIWDNAIIQKISRSHRQRKLKQQIWHLGPTDWPGELPDMPPPPYRNDPHVLPAYEPLAVPPAAVLPRRHSFPSTLRSHGSVASLGSQGTVASSSLGYNVRVAQNGRITIDPYIEDVELGELRPMDRRQLRP